MQEMIAENKCQQHMTQKACADLQILRDAVAIIMKNRHHSKRDRDLIEIALKGACADG